MTDPFPASGVITLSLTAKEMSPELAVGLAEWLTQLGENRRVTIMDLRTTCDRPECQCHGKSGLAGVSHSQIWRIKPGGLSADVAARPIPGHEHVSLRLLAEVRHMAEGTPSPKDMVCRIGTDATWTVIVTPDNTVEFYSPSGGRQVVIELGPVLVFEPAASPASDMAKDLLTDGEMRPVTARNVHQIAAAFSALAARHRMTVDVVVNGSAPVGADQLPGGVRFAVPDRGDRLVITQFPQWNSGIVGYLDDATYSWDGATFRFETKYGALYVTFLRT